MSVRCHVLVDVTRGPRDPVAKGEIRAFSKCRNELPRLPAFLDHYRGLGVDRFFIVDNASIDGSADYLNRQPDVHLFRTADRFSEAQGGTAWLNALLGEFGVGSWCVTADIDELLMYPGSDGASLRRLTRYLDENRYQALSCLLLDLYPPGPLRDSQAAFTGPVTSSALYFDSGPYTKTVVTPCPGILIRGGVRERVFYPEFSQRGLAAKIRDAARNQLARTPLLRGTGVGSRRPPAPPCLTKVPLVRWDDATRYLDCNHWISPKTVAPDTGVLLHFKLLGDFHRRATEEAARGEYYDSASEYRRYAEALNRNPNLTLVNETSVRFEGSDQLVRLGLMQETTAWAAARRAPIA